MAPWRLHGVRGPVVRGVLRQEALRHRVRRLLVYRLQPVLFNADMLPGVLRPSSPVRTAGRKTPTQYVHVTFWLATAFLSAGVGTHCP